MKNWRKFGFLLGGLLVLGACSDDDDGSENEVDLNARYFNADVHVSTSSLPQDILDFVTTNYPGATIREAEIEDNNNFEIYLSNGLELVFNQDGDFLGIDDDDNDDFGDEYLQISEIPQNILDFIAANFPDVDIDEAERENNGNYEIELENDVELIFDANGNFLGQGEDENEEDHDDEEINPADLPQNILDYITENYPNNTIIEAEKEDDGKYEVTLNNGVELEFDSEGNFLNAEDGNGEDDDDDDENDGDDD
ncbi:MAG: PepSY-like domain-containing protein [Christiangramia sp.]|nr:PepSY-like domain-containing protein [Christiangramia sp.]